MNGWIVTLILVLNFVLQSTVFHHIGIMGIKPDTALALVVSLSILLGKERGAMVGIAAGLLQDALFGSPVGIAMLSYMLVGYLVGENSAKVFKEHLVVPLIFTAGATVFKYGIIMFFNYVLGIQFPMLIYLGRFLPLEMVYNCIISIITYRFLFILFERESGGKLRINRKT